MERLASVAALTVLCLVWAVDAKGTQHADEAGPHDHSGKTVHIVFSNHLDIGFDGIDPQLGTDDAVINKYFDEYFPRAVRDLDAARDSKQTFSVMHQESK
jgi:hypothetical protein